MEIAGGPIAAGGSRWPRTMWAKPLRVHLSVIIVMLLVAISIPLMWLTFREGRQSAIASAEQQMLLLSRNTIELYDSVFQDGHSIVTMGSVLPSLLAEPPAFMDAKREFLMRALKGTSHVDGVYVGYGSGAFFHMLRVEDNAALACFRVGARGHGLRHAHRDARAEALSQSGASSTATAGYRRERAEPVDLRSAPPSVVQGGGCRRWPGDDRPLCLGQHPGADADGCGD